MIAAIPVQGHVSKQLDSDRVSDPDIEVIDHENDRHIFVCSSNADVAHLTAIDGVGTGGTITTSNGSNWNTQLLTLSDPDLGVVTYLLGFISESESDEIRQLLESSLEDEDSEVRAYALWGLLERGSGKAIPAAIAQLAGPDVREVVLEAVTHTLICCCCHRSKL